MAKRFQKPIMFVGTCSDAGKSIINTAFCRIFKQDGYSPAPFKAQNMSLNSFSTPEGGEMGRAQVVQAEACGISPHTDMNPVLLKPTTDKGSQIILNGKPVGNMSAKDYFGVHAQKEQLFKEAQKAFERLRERYNPVVLEGAGSISEVNLRDRDITNMRMALYAGADTYLVADIDRGGVFASVYGSIALLRPEERALIKGVIINKFRGDVTLLTPAIDFLEKKTGKPVLGVVPHIDQMGIDDEDSVSLEEKQAVPTEGDIRIAVIQTPKISNFTDFDALAHEKDVALYYVKAVEDLGEPDVIMLPGSKNTTEDMLYLGKSGLGEKILAHAKAGKAVIGICGGYQMLGEVIRDPQHTESQNDEAAGLGLLGMETVFASEKLTSQVVAQCQDLHFMGQSISADNLQGYEIHMGHTAFTREADKHPFTVCQRRGTVCASQEGTANAAGNVFGTYIHGVFDNDVFRRSVLNAIRHSKGLEALANTRNVMAEKQQAYEHLADVVENALDMEKLYQIMGEKTC